MRAESAGAMPIVKTKEGKTVPLFRVLALGMGLAAFGLASAQTVGIGTNPPGSITYSIAAAVAKVVADRTGLQTRLQPMGGQNASLPGVNAGELHLGLGNAIEFQFAVQGKEVFEGPPLKELRLVTRLMALQVALFVPTDSPVNAIADLKGKRVGTGYAQQRGLGLIVEGLLANAGLGLSDIISVPVANVVRNADDFAQGRTDVMFFALGGPQVREVGTKKGGLRSLAVDPSEAAMARVRKLLPSAYATLVRPNPALYGVVQPTQTLAFDYLLISSLKISEDLIYQVTKALHASKAELLATFVPLGRAFDPDRMAVPVVMGEYHPGAVRFYREIGQWPPK